MAAIRTLQEQGQFDASIAELDQVLARDPGHAEANYRLGLALVQTGEPSRAVWPLQKAAEASDYEISAGVLLASTHFQTQNFDEAIRAADRVLAVEPDRQAALRIRANANVAARRLDAAYADTSRLVALYPKDYGVRALHATVLARSRPARRGRAGARAAQADGRSERRSRLPQPRVPRARDLRERGAEGRREGEGTLRRLREPQADRHGRDQPPRGLLRQHRRSRARHEPVARRGGGGARQARSVPGSRHAAPGGRSARRGREGPARRGRPAGVGRRMEPARVVLPIAARSGTARSRRSKRSTSSPAAETSACASRSRTR